MKINNAPPIKYSHKIIFFSSMQPLKSLSTSTLYFNFSNYLHVFSQLKHSAYQVGVIHIRTFHSSVEIDVGDVLNGT